MCRFIGLWSIRNWSGRERVHSRLILRSVPKFSEVRRKTRYSSPTPDAFGDLNIIRFVLLVMMFVVSIIFLIISPNVIVFC